MPISVHWHRISNGSFQRAKLVELVQINFSRMFMCFNGIVRANSFGMLLRHCGMASRSFRA